MLRLKILLLKVLSELEFYGDFVYKFRKSVGRTEFLINLVKLTCYKRVGYKIVP